MTLVRVLDLLGIGVFAVSGALAAGRRGSTCWRVRVGLGDGDRWRHHPRPPARPSSARWLTDATYLGLIVVAVAVTFAYVRWRRPPLASLLVADALGLALFSVAGAQIAESAGLPAVSVVVLGTVTGWVAASYVTC
jgi:uncharacterized membrane protein YeiH